MGYSTQLYSKGYKGYSSQGVLKGYPKVLKGYSRGALEAVRSSGGLPEVTFSILTAADRAGLCTLGQAARREIEPATGRHAHPARDDVKWVQMRSGPQSKPYTRCAVSVRLTALNGSSTTRSAVIVLSARGHELVRASACGCVRACLCPSNRLRACLCPSNRLRARVRACVRASMRACVRACVRASVRACVRAYGGKDFGSCRISVAEQPHETRPIRSSRASRSSYLDRVRPEPLAR
jgi:hypothetical protein